MFGLSAAVRVYLATNPADMRKSFDGLSALTSSSLALDPLSVRLGYRRLEKPVAAVEKVVKGLLFDCQMCGQCALSAAGMSCPMNCPKNLRNGPCGGVRANGHCEVRPEMKCVWVQAVAGAARIPGGTQALQSVQVAVDRRLQGKSSWLRVVRQQVGETP